MANFRLSVRKIEKGDLPVLVSWAKNSALIKHFHVPLPQTEQAAGQWFQLSLINKLRDDFVIYVADEDGNKKPIGMMGLFNIDEQNKKAEYYVIIGDSQFIRRGIAYRTSMEMLSKCFGELGLNKIVLHIDIEHYEAQHLAEKLGFRREGILSQDILLEDGAPQDRLLYGQTAQQWHENNTKQ